MLSRLFSKFGASLAVFFVCAGLVSVANAEDRPGKAEAAQYEKMLAQQEQGPGASAAAEDIEKAHEWLSDAKVLLANGDEEGAAVLLRRVGFGLDLITAVTKVGSIQQAADEQEAAYYKANQEQIPGLEAEIEALNNQKSKLKSQLR